MKNLDNYLTELKKQLPDVEERLNPGVVAEKGVAGVLPCTLPSAFVELYQRINGERPAPFTGFIAGFAFMPLDRVLSEMQLFQTLEYEMTVVGTTVIREDAVKDLTWIPFAFDGSRAYLAIDMTPSEAGKVGQIISVDFERDRCYLLADNLDDLFGRMTAWLQQGILLIDKKEEALFIAEKSGHLFHSLDELAIWKEPEKEGFVSLPDGYWMDRYKKVLIKEQDGSCKVPVECLAKEKSIMIKAKQLSCEPFAYMENLKELIFHDCEIENLHGISQAKQLQKLIFVRCTFIGEDLSVLSTVPCLKEISINEMAGNGLASLSKIKTLKGLSLRKISGIDESTLSVFDKLQELSIQDIEIHDGTFIGNCKNLKLLNLNHLHMDNLDFLSQLTKLTEFELSTPAANEEGLHAVMALGKLKSFLYPVRNLNIYKGHPCLKTIGMAADVEKGFESFAGSQVDSFVIFGKVSEEHMKMVKTEMGRYVQLCSYGCREV